MSCDVDFIAKNESYSLLKVLISTGKKNQIRVALSHLGHPILGDSLYGKPSIKINRQALHAYKITFIHPISSKEIILETDLPDDMKLLNK